LKQTEKMSRFLIKARLATNSLSEITLTVVSSVDHTIKVYPENVVAKSLSTSRIG